MHTQKYYRIGTLIGFALAAIIPFIALDPSPMQMTFDPAVAVALLFGVAYSYNFARQLDLHCMGTSFLETNFYACGIFFTGAALGCFANFILHHVSYNNTAGAGENLVAWAYKPLFYLGTWGLLWAVVLATLYYLGARAAMRLSTPQASR